MYQPTMSTNNIEKGVGRSVEPIQIQSDITQKEEEGEYNNKSKNRTLTTHKQQQKMMDSVEETFLTMAPMSLTRSKSLSPIHQKEKDSSFTIATTSSNNGNHYIVNPYGHYHKYPLSLAPSFQACHQHAEKLLSVLQPSPVSEEQRSFVFNAISNILNELGLQTYLYGSVAFKTYLPDGDIDISVFETTPPAEKNHLPWYTKVWTAFKMIQEKKDSPLIIKDIYFINAEVKLIKCIVNDIPVDMSSNQAGGLSTLCFLQEVDQLIGRDHLFKRSIILMKAWCYYESRILGSHHGLLSTYALTILIMYIFNVYYDELESPLEVLYYVLQYFSKFDWDNYAISIDGPVSLQSLSLSQDSTAGTSEIFRNSRWRKEKHFFSKEFLSLCVEKYARYDNLSPNAHRVFVPKFMNIIDPLRDYNNLGRSVSRNNHLRIRRAFKKGAKTLHNIIYDNILHNDRILISFFATTVNHFQILKTDNAGIELNSQASSEQHPNNNGNASLNLSLNGRSRSSSLIHWRQQKYENVATPPSPNWIKSNKIFDSKLEDCHANLLNATISSRSMNGEALRFDDTLSVKANSQLVSFRNTNTKPMEKEHMPITQKDVSPEKKIKNSKWKAKNPNRQDSQNKQQNNHSNSAAHSNAGSSSDKQSNKSNRGNGKSSSSNSSNTKKFSSKGRKAKTNTLSDYINLELVSAAASKSKARQQQKAKKNTPSKSSSENKPSNT